MRYRAGFDVGGTNARVHLFDESMTPISGRRARIREAEGPDEVAAVLSDLLSDACADSEIDVAQIGAIGIGLAGQLSTDGRTVINAPNLGWRNIDFVETLESALSTILEEIPAIRIINDLNAQLWGESIDGSVAAVEDVLAIYVGTGIGGAILAGGELLTGAGGNAGEIGHSKVVVGGRPCGCGERGCVEAYAGGVHLEMRLAELVEDSDDDALSAIKLEPGSEHRIDLGAADELAVEHPALAQIWEEATDYLAMVMANACTLLNPAVLLVGGGVMENCRHFRSMTLQKAVPLVLEVARANLEVRQASPGELSGMLGAADLAGRSQK